MKYFEVEFTISPFSADAADLLASLAGEAGFETFEETENGLKGYVQQTLFNEEALRESIDDFPFEGTHIIYNVSKAEDRDWNEQWEQAGFEPIVVANQLVIHDGRHLPTFDEGTPMPISIEIDAKLAFGTGTHETTRMICAQLISMLSPQDANNKRVLDCGTGTGILSICALKLGAKEAVGYDIDEWSVDNARHNAVINQVDNRFTSLHGDASILHNIEGAFDIVLANINRNILLADMPTFVAKMQKGAFLVLSGFYTDDCSILQEKAQTLGLTLVTKNQDNEWACMVFKY